MQSVTIFNVPTPAYRRQILRSRIVSLFDAMPTQYDGAHEQIAGSTAPGRPPNWLTKLSYDLL